VRGVILAGGRATRLRPLSLGRNKHLLAVHDRPLVCYALRTLVTAGVREILVVTNAEHTGEFRETLGSGSRFGCRLSYAAQDPVRVGTGAALVAADGFAGGGALTVILGDNIFTENVGRHLQAFERSGSGFEAKILVREVPDPDRYGVVVLRGGRIVDVIEKPAAAPGRIVATGLWMFRPCVFDRLLTLKPSARGEYEMTDVLAACARAGTLAHAFVAGPWMDVGTVESFAVANAFFAGVA
jgi:glucose-1-phosphate thymidylyltransferase